MYLYFNILILICILSLEEPILIWKQTNDIVLIPEANNTEKKSRVLNPPIKGNNSREKESKICEEQPL